MKQKNNFKLKTPVLFLVFNRPETTKKVFAEIKKAKPAKLYIAADGPRNQGEKKKTDTVRNHILKNINWKCKVKKLFRDKNLGCKYAVSSAINWFFENEEQGIILEDDCLPSQSFFRFCQELLEKYKDDEKIIHISGTNIEGISNMEESYFFSRIANIWGWATWRKAWKNYDVEMKDWPNYSSVKGMKKLGYSGTINKIISWRLLNLTYNKKIDTWDFQWDFCLRKNNGLSIIPKRNLITNIGFWKGTHTINKEEDKKRRIKRCELKFPLKENRKVSKTYMRKYFKFFRPNLKSALARYLKFKIEGKNKEIFKRIKNQ